MIRFPENIKAILFRCRVRYLRPLMVTLVLVALLGAGVAWSEYQTNWFARRLGAFLLSTNALRPASGALWNDIQAQVRTQQAIDTVDPLPVPRAGLPDAVIRSRFEGSRVPESGVPIYVAVYKIPLPGVESQYQTARDVMQVCAFTNRACDVKALHLPDVQFPRGGAQTDRYLYAQVGDIEVVCAR